MAPGICPSLPYVPLVQQKRGRAAVFLPQIFPRDLLAWIKVGWCSGHWGLIVGRQTLWSSWGGPSSHSWEGKEPEVIAPPSDNLQPVSSQLV